MSASREKRLRREIREAENNSDIVKKVKKQKKPMNIVKARRIKSAIYSVVAVVLVLAIALLIFVNTGFMQEKGTALTVGDHKVSPAMFNYYYQDTYYNLYNTYASYGLWDYMVDTTKSIEDQTCFASEDGGTWSEYLTASAADSAKQIYALYDAAAAEGFTLDEDTKASIAATADTLESYAQSAGVRDGDAYLEASYGKGATVESYLEYMELQQLVSSFALAKSESFTYTEEDLQNFYSENAQSYDKVTYRVFTVAEEEGSNGSAKETADAMAAELTSTEDSFAKAALAYAPEDQASYYEDEDYTLRRGYTYSSITTEYADWLFSAERVEGEAQVFATDSGYSVVMFVSKDVNDYDTVNVRHILVQVGATGEDGTSTTEDWDAALAGIEEIEALWADSEMTEDAFAALANEHSEDTGSNTNGGLYENVYKGRMVTEFEDWCFDEARQIGDTGIVKTDYGYHFMYYSGTGDLYWKTLADAGLRSQDYDAWFTEFSASYTAELNGFGQMFTTKKLARLTGSTATA